MKESKKQNATHCICMDWLVCHVLVLVYFHWNFGKIYLSLFRQRLLIMMLFAWSLALRYSFGMHLCLNSSTMPSTALRQLTTQTYTQIVNHFFSLSSWCNLSNNSHFTSGTILLFWPWSIVYQSNQRKMMNNNNLLRLFNTNFFNLFLSKIISIFNYFFCYHKINALKHNRNA